MHKEHLFLFDLDVSPLFMFHPFCLCLIIKYVPESCTTPNSPKKNLVTFCTCISCSGDMRVWRFTVRCTLYQVERALATVLESANRVRASTTCQCHVPWTLCFVATHYYKKLVIPLSKSGSLHYHHYDTKNLIVKTKKV